MGAESGDGILGLAGLAGQDRRAKTEEAEQAQAIQSALLPRDVPQTAAFEIACAWKLSRTVSGDLMDVFPLEGGRMALTIADVAGKGLAAARLMQEMHAAVREYAPQAASAAELCTLVNRAISVRAEDARYITMLYGVLDLETRKLQYENAGHCLPLLMRADGRVEFPASFSGVMGIFTHWIYQNQETELQPGDWLLMLTDGVIGAENRRGRPFGYQRLITLLQSARGRGAHALGQDILAAVAEFAQGKLKDDASLIVILAR